MSIEYTSKKTNNILKILHLFSNWKWTGPAEHALNLVSTLKKQGHNITFACGKSSHFVKESLFNTAIQRNITPLTLFYLNKHFHIFHNILDIIKLRAFINQNKFQVIHTHLPNDHFLASMSAWNLKGIKIIKSCYEGEELKRSWLNFILYTKRTDGVICASERVKKSLIKVYHYPQEFIWKIQVPVDTEKFTPLKRSEQVRTAFGIKKDEVVVGIVARVQPHRRFEVLLPAIAELIKKMPNLKLMIIGRGTHIEKIAKIPVAKLGIANQVIFTGYRLNDYPETLACLDIKVFLVPGTDGACRAVREAMATGIPVIAARRGMLPEIIDDGVNGLLIDDTKENLSQAIEKLILNPDLRKGMGEKARLKALSEFSLPNYVKKVEKIYQQILGL